MTRMKGVVGRGSLSHDIVAMCGWRSISRYRLIDIIPKQEHIMPLLRDLHWLRVPERVAYKLCVLVYRCFQNLAPSYLAHDIQLLADVNSHWRLRSWDYVIDCVKCPWSTFSALCHSKSFFYSTLHYITCSELSGSVSGSGRIAVLLSGTIRFRLDSKKSHLVHP